MKQPLLQSHIKEILEKHPAKTEIFLLLKNNSQKEVCRDFFEEIVSKYENEEHNMLYYWAKLMCLVFVTNRSDWKTYKTNLSSLYDEIKKYTNPEDSKQLLEMIDAIRNPIFKCINDYICNGLYGKALKEIGNIGVVNVTGGKIQGKCLKELRRYDEALKLLLIDYEEGKVNIACCFILTGEIEKGIKLFESLTELNAED